jgi:glycine betaine/proline transport system ATP-binding protein
VSHALRFEAVDVLLPRPGPHVARRTAAALADCARGATRAEVMAAHDVVIAVQDVSLAVARGAITVIVGPSGSGKSTLLRTVNRLAPVTRGHVWVRTGDADIDAAGCDDVTLRRLRRHHVAMVFQQFALLPNRSVEDNVGFGLELRGDAADVRQRVVQEKLALVGLADAARRHVHELSGGMQQRVGLARALATDPDVLLMDEPFSALDASMRRKLQDELRALQGRLHTTIVFVTHDLDEAVRLGDQLGVLVDGRLVQVGTPSEVVRAPATPEVADLVQHARL